MCNALTMVALLFNLLCILEIQMRKMLTFHVAISSEAFFEFQQYNYCDEIYVPEKCVK